MKVLDYTTGLYTLALKMVFSLQIENPLLSLIPRKVEEEMFMSVGIYVVVKLILRKSTHY